MKKLNVGIIGFGWVATAHINAINAGEFAQVSAIFSSRKHDDAELSKTWGSAIKSYTDLDEMLKDKSIDAVSICSYTYQHTEHALAAAKAGKHIILEKPMALSWEDCQEIEKAVKEANVKFCICFECRWSNQFISTKEVVDQGLIGDIHYGEIDYLHGIGPWYGQFEWNAKKTGGGSSLLTAGCHALDSLLMFMGSDVEEVTSYDTKTKSEIFKPYEYTTTSVTILKFKSGKIAKCAASVDCLQPYYFHTHLFGSEGSILDNKFHSNKLKSDKTRWSDLSMKMLDSGDVADHPYQLQFDTFFQSILNGTDMPLTGLKEAMKTHEVIFAADKSAATGKSVKL
ncbi:Gfo/Idh/MocA family oxidoreductase [uncultured Cyclobacterium sp.]|uniref:Gfo/Idh/MocA family protein n=1 Tax=uncultured Cyclobacterium sp. TaxID=453820 RepID=UPI0030EB3102|tara:strand:+ start:13022 stop:14044 length:1023 start_codon:yes stop_codon:yes gene_type:complete